MDQNFLKKEFEHLVLISLHDESRPPDVFSSPTLVNQETPLILEEESDIPFVPFPPPFSVLMQVPPCNDHKVMKFAHQITNPSSHPPSAFHDSNPIEETLEWLIFPMVKTNFSIPQDGINTHNSTLEYDSNLYHPL